MSDPLTLLRELTINGVKAYMDSDNLNLIIGEYQAPKDAKTNFKKATTGYYTIEAIWYLLENSKTMHPQYIKEANAKKVPKVTLADRKDILSYVRGDISTTAKINATAISGTATLRSKAVEKRKADEISVPTASQDAKRVRLDQESVVTRDLSADITKDKISELRAKRDRAKRQEQSLQSRQHGNIRQTQEIIKREQLIRNRSTVLLSKGKKFTEVLALLNKVQEDERSKEKAKNSKREKQKPTTYNRYEINNDTFYSKKNAGIEEFGIDTYGGSGREKEQPKPAPQPKSPASKSNSKKKSSKPPIIIVPNGKVAAINLQNVKYFLEESRYMTSAEAKEQARKTQFKIDPKVGVAVNHLRKDSATGVIDKAQKYIVLDSVQRLTKEDWPRVVAVFVQGPEWQFKGWPFETPANIFNTVSGFYLRMESTKPHENIKKWNIKTLTLNSRSRHMDQVAVLQFWGHIDQLPK